MPAEPAPWLKRQLQTMPNPLLGLIYCRRLRQTLGNWTDGHISMGARLLAVYRCILFTKCYYQKKVIKISDWCWRWWRQVEPVRSDVDAESEEHHEEAGDNDQLYGEDTSRFNHM